MKKKLVVLLTTVMIATLLTGCSGSEEGSSKKENSSKKEAKESTVDMSDVKLLEDGVLTVGMEVGYPPFEEFAEDGETIIGFDVDIVEELADKLGVEVEYVNTSFDAIFAGIDVNYDLVCSAITMTAERAETMLFSTPYINNYQAVCLPVDSDLEIKSFDDLEGKTVALQKASSSDALFSDLISTGSLDCEIIASEKIISCFTQLENGEVDAVVVDSTVADGVIAGDPGKYEIVYEDEEEVEQFGIAMGKENTALQKAVNEALAQMDEEGFIDDTYEYWFGSAEE